MAKRIVVASGKGGVGKTTVSIGTASALQKRGKRVLLMDFDDLRSVDLLLGVADRVVYDWGDIVFDRCAPEDAVLKPKGLAMLPCPTDYANITPAAIRALMERFDADYDYILLDAPAGLGTGFSLACAGANRGIVVASADPVSVRSACKAAWAMEDAGIRSCRLVINRAVKRDIRRKHLLNIDDVIDKAEVQLLGIVPEDSALRRAAMGAPIYDATQQSYMAFTNIAGRLEGENLPLSFM